MNPNENQLGNRVQRKKEETKHKIIDVAIQLFKSNGIDETTMEQIAREVDIAKGTLYNYFPVKEAILDEFIKRSFSQNNAERMVKLREIKGIKSQISAIFRELMKGVQAQKEIFEKYIVYRVKTIVSFYPDDSEKSGLYMLGNEIIKLGQESGEIRNDLPLSIMEDLFEFAFIEVAKQFYLDPENFNADETIAKCVDIFINGVRQNEAHPSK